MNAGAIDSAIDAFIDGDMEFAQLRRTLELHVGRNPARRGPAKARLDGLLEAGTMSTALHRILVEELDRSVSEEVTIAADEEGDGPREPEAPAAFGAGPPQGELDEFLEPTLPDDRPELPPAPTAPADDAGADARPAGADAPEAPAVKLEPSAGEAPEAGPEFPSEPVAGGEEAAAPRPEGDAAGPETADTGDDLADRAEPAVAAGPGHMLAGRYVLESLLGRGGMSVVFRGRDLRIPEGEDGAQGVAVKLLTPEFARRADARAALAREAAFSRRLQHPAFVRIFDCDVTGPVPFLVMELLQGEQLRRLLVRRYPSPLPLAEAMTVIRGLAEALSHLHRAGVVHGDVKPGNVFLDPGGQVRLLDLGVAGSAEDSGASPLRARTPAYASPALLSGQPASAADDVYALGCVAYEVLAGHHPFGKLPGDEAAASDAVAERIETLSTARWQALQRSLQFDPARRQPDAGSFLAEFFPPPEPRRRTRPWAAGGILAGLLLGLALGWFLPPPEGVVSGARSLFERGRPLVGQTNPEERAGTGEARPEAVEPQAGAAAPAEVGDRNLGDPDTQTTPAITDEGSGAAETSAAVRPGPAEAGSEPVRETQASSGTAPAEEDLAPGGAAAPVLTLSSEILRVSEGSSALKLSILRPEGYSGPMRVEWRTVAGTAEDGSDYAGGGWQELEAPAGAVALVLYVPIVNDGRQEPPESFFVQIRSAPGEGARVGDPDSAQVIILDDD